MESSSVITPEDVLETLMNDGTFDALRLQIINQLKADEELKSLTIKLARRSKILNTPGAEKQTKRELFDALRYELENPVLEKVSKLVWELILDGHGLGKEISETVEKVFCRLSGRELPVVPDQNGEKEPEKDMKKERKNEKKRGKEKRDEKEKEKSNSKSKKRNIGEMSGDGSAAELASKSSDASTVPDESNELSVDRFTGFASPLSTV